MQQVVRNLTQSVTFNCEATGYPAPNIEWFKDGQPMNYIRPNLVVGGYTMKLKNLQSTDTGHYKCQVRNEKGDVFYTYSLVVKGK